MQNLRADKGFKCHGWAGGLLKIDSYSYISIKYFLSTYYRLSAEGTERRIKDSLISANKNLNLSESKYSLMIHWEMACKVNELILSVY